jgi:hypothetical protein
MAFGIPGITSPSQSTSTQGANPVSGCKRIVDAGGSCRALTDDAFVVREERDSPASARNAIVMRHVVLALWLATSIGFPNPGVAASAVVLATTTSTQDTDLLDVLVPAFERATR